jgi:hypothetical protein
MKDKRKGSRIQGPFDVAIRQAHGPEQRRGTQGRESFDAEQSRGAQDCELVEQLVERSKGSSFPFRAFLPLKRGLHGAKRMDIIKQHTHKVDDP